jgi:glutathione S-transferase
MCDASGVPGAAASPEYVRVYGNDHSPWVQAVLLGLHERKIAYALELLPPLTVFRYSGVLMPAASIDGAPWMLDSEKILVELGFSEVEPETRRALQRFFLSSAMRRADHPWEFWNRFSRVRGGHPRFGQRLWNQFWRAFSMLYFFWLISLGRRGTKRATPEQLVAELDFFQQRLTEEQAFLGGERPDTADLQLFGIVQMCGSVPGLAYDVLREHPELARLRAWIGAMQGRFAGYDRLYTAVDFEPRLARMEPAPVLEQVAYWSGAVLMWLALPITLPIALFYAQRVTREGLRGP